MVYVAPVLGVGADRARGVDIERPHDIGRTSQLNVSLAAGVPTAAATWPP
jgi:hypothetical protein